MLKFARSLLFIGGRCWETLVSKLEPEVRKLFREIMLNCKRQRKAAAGATLRELARRMEISENYLSSIENGRVFPSIKVFLAYLVLNSFDLSALRQLSIGRAPQGAVGAHGVRLELLSSISAMNEVQLDFMVQQAKLVEDYKVRSRRKRGH